MLLVLPVWIVGLRVNTFVPPFLFATMHHPCYLACNMHEIYCGRSVVVAMKDEAVVVPAKQALAGDVIY